MEEAKIIPAAITKPKEKARYGFVGEAGFGPEKGDKEKEKGEANAALSEGGMGKLDVGWLNSRSGRVGRDMEAELWKKSRVFLEGIDGLGANGDSQNGERGEDQDMSG